jgi:predicted nucleic acid-binding protein
VLLVDTNIWLAGADRRSADHDRCARLLLDHQDDLAAVVPVIAETAWLILDRLGTSAHSRFVHAVSEGSVQPLDLTDVDWRRCAELIDTYTDLRLDLIDAAVVAVAERNRLTTLATMNRRDFSVIRPAHCDSFELLP